MAMKFKDIRKALDERGIDYWLSENGQRLYIKACAFSPNNFFDYGEEYKKPQCDNNDYLMRTLFEDSRIKITTCDLCCSCAGW